MGSEKFLSKKITREPVPRAQHLAVSLNSNSVSVMGGKYLGRALADSYLLDFRASKWNVRSLTFPSGRFGMAGGIWNEQLWCYGGSDGRSHLSDLLIWDLRSSSWRKESFTGNSPSGGIVGSTLMDRLLLTSTDQGLWALDLEDLHWVFLDQISTALVSTGQQLLSLGQTMQICSQKRIETVLANSDLPKTSEESSSGSSNDQSNGPSSGSSNDQSSGPSNDYQEVIPAGKIYDSESFTSSDYTSDSDDEFLEVESFGPELPPRNSAPGVPLLSLPEGEYESSDILTTSREVRDLRRQLAEQEVLLQVQQQRNEQLRARILELQQEKSVQGESEELSLLTQKTARILELEQEIETWMLESAKLQRLGEEAVNDLSRRYESLQADFAKLKGMYQEELSHRQKLEEKIPQLEALLEGLGG